MLQSVWGTFWVLKNFDKRLQPNFKQQTQTGRCSELSAQTHTRTHSTTTTNGDFTSHYTASTYVESLSRKNNQWDLGVEKDHRKLSLRPAGEFGTETSLSLLQQMVQWWGRGLQLISGHEETSGGAVGFCLHPLRRDLHLLFDLRTCRDKNGHQRGLTY